MNIQNANYAENKKNKKKKLIALLLLITAIVTLVGVVAAYYSDLFGQTGQINSATLDIDGTYTVYLNGNQTTLSEINSLNPGDVIVINGNISNLGSQSAWVREKITFETTGETILNYFRVYDVALAQTDFTPGEERTENLINLSGGTAVSGNRVINGTGENAQTESGEDHDYIGDDNYEFVLTIYFMHIAPNSTQGEAVTLTMQTQALQFKNNTTEPNDAAWNTVVAA